MKKIINIMMVIVSILAFACPILASEMQVESTLVYTSEDTFYVSIPEIIVVGEEAYIEAMEMNVAPNKKVYVDLQTANDYIEIYSENDNSKSLHVRFSNTEGNGVTVGNPTVVSFDAGENGTKSFTTYIEDTTSAIAGEYTGSVTFNIYCN